MRTHLRRRLREALCATWGIRPEQCLDLQTDAALAVVDSEVQRYLLLWLSARRRVARLRADHDEWKGIAVRAQALLEQAMAERNDAAEQADAYRAMRDEVADLLDRVLSLRVTVRDPRAVDGITRERMVAYLAGHGWERREVATAFEVWWEKASGGQVVVPRDASLRDYTQRVHEVLNTVAVVEGRSPVAVMIEITEGE